MICRPEDENGDVLPVLSSSDLLRDISAFGSHDESNIAAYIPVFPDDLTS